MARWAAFAGLLAVSLFLLLALARASQSALSGDDDPVRFREPSPHDPRPTDPVVPRFERPVADPRARLSPGALLANVVVTQGLFGAVVVGAAVYFSIPPWALGIPETALARGLPGVAVGIGFGVTLWLANEAAGAIADATGAGYDEAVRELLAPDSVRGWVLLLGVALPTVAVVEEVVFRGAAIGALAAGFSLSPWLLAVVSSVVFGAAHGAQGKVGMLVTGGLGLALAAGYVLTNSLLVVVVAHYLVNALELAVHEGMGYDRLTVETFAGDP
ncbi:lysostaphin resistance A-like protein [Halomicrobium sp. HM KBTZ05]|uniref:CPBP family intramembrane glutamic endopeptidase n=1 Tax=Halomicrobium sp. HM KBTZ05 TaxID=3242663 RepID=UPI003556B345